MTQHSDSALRLYSYKVSSYHHNHNANQITLIKLKVQVIQIKQSKFYSSNNKLINDQMNKFIRNTIDYAILIIEF